MNRLEVSPAAYHILEALIIGSRMCAADCIEDRHSQCGHDGSRNPFSICGCPCHGQFGPMCGKCWKNRTGSRRLPSSVKKTKPSQCVFCHPENEPDEFIRGAKLFIMGKHEWVQSGVEPGRGFCSCGWPGPDPKPNIGQPQYFRVLPEEWAEHVLDIARGGTKQKKPRPKKSYAKKKKAPDKGKPRSKRKP